MAKRKSHLIEHDKRKRSQNEKEKKKMVKKNLFIRGMKIETSIYNKIGQPKRAYRYYCCIVVNRDNSVGIKAYVFQ